VQKDKQRSIKHTHKTKDRVTRTPLKTGDELRCSGRLSSSCSTSDTRRVNPVTVVIKLLFADFVNIVLIQIQSGHQHNFIEHNLFSP